jgi:hypothetical protein
MIWVISMWQTKHTNDLIVTEMCIKNIFRETNTMTSKLHKYFGWSIPFKESETEFGLMVGKGEMSTTIGECDKHW